MREIWVIERDRVSHDGCTVLCERKYRGLLREDGSFCLLAYCRKRVPYPREQTERLITVKEKGKDAAYCDAALDSLHTNITFSAE